MLIVTADEMREIDKYTIEGIGIPGVVLMENAGSQVVQNLKEKMSIKGCKALVLAGHGNNGGDGFVIARHLGNNQVDVETWLLSDIRKCSCDSVINFHALVHSGYRLKFWDEKNHDLLLARINEADIIIDAMLGTGVQGELREPYKKITETVNNAKAYRVAVDIPTGVNSDSGEVVDWAFKADLTVTFAFPKLGQFLFPGADYVGELKVADISIPPIVVKEKNPRRYLITKEKARELLPERPQNSHKGSFGHALIIGGSGSMAGAPLLAAKATLRSGAGLVTLAVPRGIQAAVLSNSPETMCVGLTETAEGHFAVNSAKELRELYRKFSAIGIGPGLGMFAEGSAWLKEIFTTVQPMVVDADALNILANDLSILSERKSPTIITPHPGEMARLIKKDVEFVQKNRVNVTKQFAQEHNLYVVLKGAGTLIATPSGELFINPTGGPELSKGGSGDVLTGIITGLLAQSIPVLDALILGVYLHGLAGSLASFPSNYSTLASEVINKIGLAIQQTMSIHA